MNPLLIFAGFAVGILIGMTGVGGGSVMTPILLMAGLDPLTAVGTDLLYSLPTKLLGWHVHRSQGTVRMDVVRELLIGGLPAVIGGLALVSLTKRMVNIVLLQIWMRHAIGVAICLSAVMIVVAPLVLKRFERATDAPRPLYRGRLIAIGALIGFMVSLTSIGGATLALPLLALFFPYIPFAQLVGSDIAFSALLTLFAALGQGTMGHMNWIVALNCAAGSLVGVYIGSKLCSAYYRNWLRPAVAVVLLLTGLRLA